MEKKRMDELKIIDRKTQNELERNKAKITIFKFLLISILSLSFCFAILFTLIIYTTSANFPDVAMLAENRDQTTILYDINNKPIANIHGDEDRVSVTLKEISPLLKNAVIAIEDNRFYEHNGVDLVGTIRAAYTNALGGDSIQGGSTLTQQLVKNSFLTPEKSIKRKFVEAVLALKVERLYTKDQILEMYFNRIYWGNMCYGAQKASRRYFKKDAKNINLAEASFLAGLLKAPEGFSPYRNYKGAKARQKQVLDKMEEYGYITHKQNLDNHKQKLRIHSNKQKQCKHGYFVHYIINYLMGRYGEDVVRRGGLRVYTTLDSSIQSLGEKVIQDAIKSYPLSTGATQGALVSINVENGYIQALVGGVNFEKSNFNRATQSRRAAGSSFKPVVYLTGFRLGKITPKSPITDAPISFNTGWNVWRPKNWDGRFMGKMNVRRALTLSRNTPTVRVALKVGVDKIIETARLVGIKSPIDHNFSIALGSLGISPLEMATAYSTFAREGIYIEPTAIRKIEDKNGKIIELHKPAPIRVVSKKYVKWLNSILVDVVEKGTGRSAQIKGKVVAGKTGTTDQVRDIWFSGFTPETVTSVWIGNDANTPIHGLFSSNCAQLWHIFNLEFYKLKENRIKNSKESKTKLKNDTKIKKKPAAKKTTSYKKKTNNKNAAASSKTTVKKPDLNLRSKKPVINPYYNQQNQYRQRVITPAAKPQYQYPQQRNANRPTQQQSPSTRPVLPYKRSQ